MTTKDICSTLKIMGFNPWEISENINEYCKASSITNKLICSDFEFYKRELNLSRLQEFSALLKFHKHEDLLIEKFVESLSHRVEFLSVVQQQLREFNELHPEGSKDLYALVSILALAD